jgi:hypothetical protein
MKRRPLLLQIHDAILWCAKQGIPVAPDVIGVTCVSQQHKRWARDERSPAVSPLGAVILHRQPPSADPYKAAAIALDDCGLAFIGGVEDGLTRTTPSAEMLSSARRALYIQGTQLGAWLRSELVDKRCPVHGRFMPAAIVCAICSETADGDEKGEG